MNDKTLRNCVLGLIATLVLAAGSFLANQGTDALLKMGWMKWPACECGAGCKCGEKL